MKTPKVAVVITNYNGASIRYRGRPIIDRCLESMRKTDYGNYKVLVVDDHSPDNSVNHILKRFNDVAVIRNRKPLGFARANNSGIRFALAEYNPDYILLLNDDVIVNDRNWLSSMVNVAESRRDIGIVGCRLLNPDGSVQHIGFKVTFASWDIPVEKEAGGSGSLKVIKERDAFAMAVSLIKRQVIERIGLLDGNFQMGHEDIDYCLRARRAGFKVMYDGGAEIIHLGSFTTGHAKGYRKLNEQKFYALQRNAVYFAMKNLNAPNRVLALTKALASGLVTVEDYKGARGIANIRVKEKPMARLRIALSAYRDAYALYKGRGRQRDYTRNQFAVMKK